MRTHNSVVIRFLSFTLATSVVAYATGSQFASVTILANKDCAIMRQFAYRQIICD